MTNGADAHSHVSRINQRNDDTIEVTVKTTSFRPGQAVEVSGYITQGDSYAAFNDKKHIPIPDSKDTEQPAEMHVQLPAMELDPKEVVTVVVRVAEVWPTVLTEDKGIAAEYKDHGLKAAWTAPDPYIKGSGDATSQGPDSGPANTTPPESYLAVQA